MGVASDLFNLILHVLRFSIRMTVMNDDICPSAGAGEGEESSNAAGSACDQNGLAVQGVHLNSFYHFGIVKINSDNFCLILDFVFLW